MQPFVQADGFQAFITQMTMLSHEYGDFMDMWFLVFARIVAFVASAPVFGRKDIPFNIKVSLAIAFSLVMAFTLKPGPAVFNENLMVYIILLSANAMVGYTLGFIANTIMMTVNASGSVMNNQMGLSAAMTFDPSTRQQITIVEKLFGFIGLMVFYQLGGVYWLLDAMQRSFDIFPLYALQPDIAGKISYDYLVQISGNTLTIAVQLVAPVMMITLATDLVLGIVNRTAQQIQIFQLSFALKPSIGAATLLITLPFTFKTIQDYLLDYSQLY